MAKVICELKENKLIIGYGDKKVSVNLKNRLVEIDKLDEIGLRRYWSNEENDVIRELELCGTTLRVGYREFMQLDALFIKINKEVESNA